MIKRKKITRYLFSLLKDTNRCSCITKWALFSTKKFFHTTSRKGRRIEEMIQPNSEVWMEEHENDRVITIDTGNIRPRMVSSNLLVQDDHACFIDVGMNKGIPELLGALAKKNISRENVDYVIVTHVHLDHAGAAGSLLQNLPNAKLIVHPRGARHMIDPSRLVAGATAVYGEEEMNRTYGTIVPVAAERVIAPKHEETLPWRSGREFKFFHWEGHAKHHICVLDSYNKVLFSGDAFGVFYRELEAGRVPYCTPTTAPVQFDPENYKKTVDAVVALRPSAVYPTHFGRIDGSVVLEVGEGLKKLVDGFVDVTTEHKNDGAERHKNILDVVQKMVLDDLHSAGSVVSDEKILSLLSVDLEVNVQGLEFMIDSQH